MIVLVFWAKIPKTLHKLSFNYWEAGMGILVGILTVSDKGSKGERIDESGRVIKEIVEEKLEARVKKYEVVPDEKGNIIEKLKEMVNDGIDLIFTTGGTGLSPRDVTPEATREVIDKEVPGIEEAMRMKGLQKTPHSMLSRGVAGVRKGSLIINLPGSPKAVSESLEVVLSAIPHALDIILGRGESGRQ
jgi:molybdopterin adenylyltransferase